MKSLIFIFLSILCISNAFKIAKRGADSDSDKSHNDHGASKHWGYRNQDKSVLPKDWYKSHPKCYGVQQSPINIETALCQYDDKLDTIKINGQFLNETDKAVNEEWAVSNNGHSVMLVPMNKMFTFAMKPENDEYKLLQMHFHWRGSEHYVNGHKFVAELHLVHQNMNDKNKFAVLGFLFRLSSEDNTKLNPITDKLADIIKYNSKITLDSVKLDRILPFSLKNYYRYSGSLTTPACDEVVEWFVVEEPVLTISDDQLLEFQSVEDKHGYPILANVRPVQDLNERVVRRSFESMPMSKSLKSASSQVERNQSTTLHKLSYLWHLLVSSVLVLIIKL